MQRDTIKGIMKHAYFLNCIFIVSMVRSLFILLFGWLSTLCVAQNDILTSSNLPIFIIDTEGVDIPNEPKTRGYLGIIHNPDSINTITDTFNVYDGWIGIEVRGNGTADLEKTSYLFETRKENGSNNNVELLGMPKENDWVLYAPYIDKSLIRNVMSYDIANRLGMYSSRTHYCELILNGEYRGVFVLMEKIKRDKNRVPVTKFSEASTDPEEGGYIVRIDSWFNEILGWTSDTYLVNGKERTVEFQYVYPKAEDITEDQRQYIEEVITAFEEDLYAAEAPHISDAYLPHIDLNSFVDYLLLNEFGKNPDAYRLSTYFHYDPTSVDPKIVMGPAWDHNHCYGSYAIYENKYTKWEYDNHWFGFPGQIPFWWEKFMEDSTFVKTFADRWNMHKAEIFNCELLSARIDVWGEELSQAQERNFTRWPIIGVNEPFDWNAGPTYADELTYLKEWICNRIEWMDQEIEDLEASLQEGFLNAYPNPSQGLVNISFRSNAAHEWKLNVHNLKGELVYTKRIQSKSGYNILPVELRDLSNGLYILTMINEEEVLTDKIIINR